MDAVLKVLAGSVNHELVSSFIAAGAKAVGISGIDGSLVEATPLGLEYGAVGKPVRTNPELLHLLCNAQFLPVVACIGGDLNGNIFNVNADQMAVACAAGFRADRLLFLTDVDGVRDASGRIAATLNRRQIADLIVDGVATGGMQAKLEAAALAIESGVSNIVIAPGARIGIVAQLANNEEGGTVITDTVR